MWRKFFRKKCFSFWITVLMVCTFPEFQGGGVMLNFFKLLGFFWESVPLLGEREKKQRLDQLDLQFLLVTLDVA